MAKVGDSCTDCGVTLTADNACPRGDRRQDGSVAVRPYCRRCNRARTSRYAKNADARRRVPARPLAQAIEALIARRQLHVLHPDRYGDNTRMTVCDELGISPRSLSAWRRGEIVEISGDVVDRVLTRSPWLWFDVYNEQSCAPAVLERVRLVFDPPGCERCGGWIPLTKEGKRPRRSVCEACVKADMERRRERVRALRLEGLRVREIADRLGVGRHAVEADVALWRRRGVVFPAIVRGRSVIPLVEAERAAGLYREGLTMREVGLVLGCSPSGVQRRLRVVGVGGVRAQGRALRRELLGGLERAA